ncbi:hypothetical protein VNI00_013545 [Paramarasmius palmivorus]|uniref:Piwi domain-containing protein n=1 Tax=Paramarasmius palmivorus TaxID=297713 RepID=A0AAW0BWV4_9AGAR
MRAGVYDGKKNLFMPHELDLGGNSGASSMFLSGTIQVLHVRRKYTPSRSRKAARINPESVLPISPILCIKAEYTLSEGCHERDHSTRPNLKVSIQCSIVFPGKETRPVGHGLELWRGYFQSIRPALGHVILNFDITTGMFYKPGPLMNLALEFFGKNNPNVLSPTHGLPDRERLHLQRFISGIRVKVTSGDSKSRSKSRVITVQRLSREGARQLRFEKDGAQISVADYFRSLSNNQPLRFPDVICALTASGAAFPLEKCEIIPGQIARKQVPPEVTKSMVEFSQKRPEQRLQAIKDGLAILQHGQSDYIRNFRMSVQQTSFPMTVEARQIAPPKLMYGQGSRQPTVEPRNGQWNMMDKKFVQPQAINRWAIVVFDTHFGLNAARQMAKDIIHAFGTTGMRVLEPEPVIHMANPQANIVLDLKKAGQMCLQKHGGKLGPDLLVVVLPELGNAEIYRTVKQVNPKLGGINVRPDPQSAAALTDPHNPTIIMGADVMHPAPGSTTPSYTALVANVDSDAAKYIADIRVQTARQEIIADLGDMARNLIGKYMDYRKNMEKKTNFQPQRLLFFRGKLYPYPAVPVSDLHQSDGVSESQYKQVKDEELAILRDVCTEMKINPRITFIIVAKRHHFRSLQTQSFPIADRSGTVLLVLWLTPASRTPLSSTSTYKVMVGCWEPVDLPITMCSTTILYSRVPDALQSLCFTLCHVFARATKSVSIPAPVAYADLVCARARNHYRNDLQSEVGTQTGSSSELERMRADFRPVHRNQERRTFFTVSGSHITSENRASQWFFLVKHMFLLLS